MKGIAKQALDYLWEKPLVTLVIAFLAGFAASKTVAFTKKGNPGLYFTVGLLGAFLGQFAIVYFGLTEILDHDALATFRPFFDLLAAYIGSFIIAWIVILFRPH